MLGKVLLTFAGNIALFGCIEQKSRKEADSIRLLRAREQKLPTKDYQVYNLLNTYIAFLNPIVSQYIYVSFVLGFLGMLLDF